MRVSLIWKSKTTTWKVQDGRLVAPMEIIFRPDRATFQFHAVGNSFLTTYRSPGDSVTNTSASYNNNFKCSAALQAALAVPFLPSLRPTGYHYEFPPIMSLRHNLFSTSFRTRGIINLISFAFCNLSLLSCIISHCGDDTLRSQETDLTFSGQLLDATLTSFLFDARSFRCINIRISVAATFTISIRFNKRWKNMNFLHARSDARKQNEIIK